MKDLIWDFDKQEYVEFKTSEQLAAEEESREIMMAAFSQNLPSEKNISRYSIVANEFQSMLERFGVNK